MGTKQKTGEGLGVVMCLIGELEEGLDETECGCIGYPIVVVWFQT